MNPEAPIKVPQAIITWLRDIFRGCNERITEKLSNNPNAPEESFDLTWIEYLSQYASPKTFSSWTVRIRTHYLGGLRHFGSWEIADIGMLLFFRRGGKIVRSKVALLQSKRLYPSNLTVQEEDRIDYDIGFARLADPEDVRVSLAAETEFSFEENSVYGALTAGSEQVKAIDDFQREKKLSVYYQFYNPWRLPFTQSIPLSTYETPKGNLTLGTRVVPAAAVHTIIGNQPKGSTPKVSDFADCCGKGEHTYGWCLEFFIADLLLQCKEGSLFKALSEDRIESLFYRRSGPIAAAIAISIELPEQMEDERI